MKKGYFKVENGYTYNLNYQIKNLKQLNSWNAKINSVNDLKVYN